MNYFFSKNNKENIDYIKKLDDPDLIPCLWLDGGKIDALDYNSFNLGYFLCELEDPVVFKESFYKAIKDISFAPDYIVIKGGIEDMWPVALLIMDGVFEAPCFSILETINVPLSEEDLMILDQFKKVYFLGPTKEEDAKFLNILYEIGEKNDDIEKISKKIYSIKEFDRIKYNRLEVNGFVGWGIKENILLELKGNKIRNGYEV